MHQMEDIKVGHMMIETMREAGSALELVSYAQQLILFAPHVVPMSKHLPMLMVN